MKKIVLVFVAIIAIACCASSFNAENASEYLIENSLPKSKCCCAWYVMRAMQEGGCCIGILPAWAYKYDLPLHGFEEVSKKNYKPQVGDIVVFQPVGKHIWGHIAMYTKHGWMSDYKQKGMFVYKQKTEYNIFRYKRNN